VLLQQAQKEYRVRVDSIWVELAQRLANLPDQYDAGSAASRAEAAVDDASEVTRLDVHRQFEAILTPVQLSLLGGWAQRFYQAQRRFPVHTFIR